MKVKVAQSHPTLRDPTDCTVHGILQARILEWVKYQAASFTGGPKSGLVVKNRLANADNLHSFFSVS